MAAGQHRKRQPDRTSCDAAARGPEAIVAIVTLAICFAFLMGVVIAIIGSVCVASRREDRLYSLWEEPPGAVSAGVRRLLGVWVRGDRPDLEYFHRDADQDPVGKEARR